MARWFKIAENLYRKGTGLETWHRYRLGGRLVEERLGKITLAEAKKIRDEKRIEAAREKNGLEGRERMSLAEVLDKRLARRRKKIQPGRDPSEDPTYHRYLRIVANLKRHLCDPEAREILDARSIRESDWEHYEARRRAERSKPGNATLNRELTFLRSALIRALKFDPIADVERFSEGRPGSAAHEITDAEYARLLSTSIAWVRRYLALLRDTGCREEELCLVELKSITDEESERGWGITFLAENSKGEFSTRWVPLTGLGIVAIKVQMADAMRLVCPFLFPSRKDPRLPLSPRTVQNYWRRLRRRAEVKARIHDFRHTFITQELLKGTSPEIIARLVGHTTTRMIQTTYGHLVKRHWEDLVASRRGTPEKVRGPGVDPDPIVTPSETGKLAH